MTVCQNEIDTGWIFNGFETSFVYILGISDQTN